MDIELNFYSQIFMIYIVNLVFFPHLLNRNSLWKPIIGHRILRRSFQASIFLLSNESLTCLKYQKTLFFFFFVIIYPDIKRNISNRCQNCVSFCFIWNKFINEIYHFVFLVLSSFYLNRYNFFLDQILVFTIV